MGPLLIRSRRVLLPGGETAASVLILDGRIEAIGERGRVRTLDAGELVLAAGCCARKRRHAGR
jgi:dihydroorotase-like cyclic amidohydrolase